jgi:hypothetical protein
LNLSSSDPMVTVPSKVSVAAGATSAGFTATASAVTTAQSATISASAASTVTSYTLQLTASVIALTINKASVAFGNVVINTPTTQSITLQSTGSAALTISSETLTGAGFTVSGSALPITLAPTQSTTVNIAFDPTAASAATGQLTITSNASTNSTAVIALTGTGLATVAVTPSSATATVGATQQFAASVSGTSTTAVTWTVSGTGCSGIACGTISSTGLYAAPGVAPSPATATITATSVLYPTQSASATVSIFQPAGATYYLAPSGNDKNKGLTSQTPWLTPNHPVNCGDTIIAAAGTYPYGAFESTFGPVTGSGHCFAFLKCATYDACYSIGNGTDPTNGMIFVSTSHWWVQGFEVQNPSPTGANASCFKASPLTAATITDVAFVDDIANGCGLGAFTTAPYYLNYNSGASVDYLFLIADIAYNGAQSTASCASGTSVFAPANYDTLPGTHIFVDQYFGWGNIEPVDCDGRNSTDGEGVIFDTFSQYSYTGQSVIENTITVFNGTNGLENFASATTPVYVKNNTAYGNGAGLTVKEYCGEIVDEGMKTLYNALYVGTANIAKTNAASHCGTTPYSALMAGDLTSQNVFSGNWGYSAAGYNTFTWGTYTGFSFGTANTLGTDPEFANPPTSIPSAPNCAGYANAPACMASLISGMTPKAPGTAGLGYQPVSSTSVYDPLYPQLLCSYSSQLAGLVTQGCSAQ